MQLMLAVLTPLKWQGRLLPVNRSPFVIGREPSCQLRANSPTVSSRHCALLVRGDRVFVRDLAAIPGTFVNDRQVQGELEVRHLDRVKVGSLMFTIRLESDSVQCRTEPVPASSAEAEEDAAANLLLALEEPEKREDFPQGPSAANILPTPGNTNGGEPSKSCPAKTGPTQPELPDTAAAARNLLARFNKPRQPGFGYRTRPASH